MANEGLSAGFLFVDTDLEVVMLYTMARYWWYHVQKNLVTFFDFRMSLMSGSLGNTKISRSSPADVSSTHAGNS